MDLAKVIAELHQERDRIDEAILALERFGRGGRNRRGRPPKWLAAAESKRRGRPSGAKGMSKAERNA